MYRDSSVFDVLDDLSEEDIESGITVQREVMLDPFRVLCSRESIVPGYLTPTA